MQQAPHRRPAHREVESIFSTSEPAEALAKLLTGLAPGELDRFCVVSGRSEANEAAIKLARLGAGYQPIGAMMCGKRIHDAIDRGSRTFQHGHTVMGHPLACAASLAVVRAILDRALLPRVRATGAELLYTLANHFSGWDCIGDIRGRGLLIGLELVRDRTSKRPFDPSLQLHKRIKQAALANGLLCYPAGGTVDGQSGDHILLAPPFILHINEIQMISGAEFMENLCGISIEFRAFEADAAHEWNPVRRNHREPSAGTAFSGAAEY